MAKMQASSMPENRSKLRLGAPMMIDILTLPHRCRNRRGTIGNLASLLALTPPQTVLVCLSQRE